MQLDGRHAGAEFARYGGLQSGRVAYDSMMRHIGETQALGNRHGDKKSYRRAHGGSRSRTVLHAAGFRRIDAIIDTAAPVVRPPSQSQLHVPCHGSAGALTKKQSDALNTYNDAVKNFKSILAERRAQINS